MMNAAGILISGFFDLLLVPFRTLPHFWGLLFISLLSGLGMITVFRFASNQNKISMLRRRMGGEILGILLHLSNPGTVVKFAVKLIWSNTVYLMYILIPLILLAIPFMLVWGQLDARYGAAEMDKDDPVTVTVFFEDGLPARDNLEIGVSGLELMPPVLFIDTLDEVSFRILPDGNSLRNLQIEGVSVKVARTGDWNGCRILRGFDSGSSFSRLFSPWIVRVDGGPGSGWYSLPDIRYAVFGGHWSWIAVFLLFSSISAIAGAKIFKVKI
ncbi:MAG: hypothetical protein KAR44_01240 [Candidatus Aegiribacteria sp.]|nr:hypothetical protein [Candidatus Aegiribacteria sp.]